MRVLFYSADILGSSVPGAPFQGTAPRSKGGEPKYIEVLQPRAGSLNIKLLSLIKENQISQVKEFSAFLYMGRCRESGLTEIFPFVCISPTWGSILCFFTSRAPLREWEFYWLLVIMYVSPSRVPIGLRDSHRGLDSLMTMTSLLTEKAGILHFSELFH